MSPSREDYLLSIFRLSQEEGFTTNKDLSFDLQVSRPSVTEMVRRLVREGYVHKINRRIVLTESGEQKAKSMLSKHRLWEHFLVEVLKFPQDQVHTQADLLEHGTTDELFDALNAYMNYPKKSVMGHVIYANEE